MTNIATAKLTKLAVPVVKDEGLDSKLSGHFGRAPGFMTLLSDGSEASYFNTRTARQPSECAPVSALAKEGVACVLARSMGRGALLRCHQAGIKIYQTQAETLSELLEEFSQGRFVDFPDAALCRHGSESGAHCGGEGNHE